MNIVQPTEENKKAIYERQEQEKRRMQQRIEQEEAEEEERLRRLRQRQGMAFLSYIKQRLDEEEAMRKHKRYAELQSEFFRRHALETRQRIRTMRENAARHDEAVEQFLFPEGERDGLGEKSSQRTVERSELCALAMGELSRKPENRAEVEKVFMGIPLPQSIRAQRAECISRVNQAVAEYRGGDLVKLKKMIKEGLLTACHAFSHTRDTLAAIHWSKQINSILSIAERRKLLRDESYKSILEAAAGMAAIGRVMENGLAALDELCTARIDGVSLTEDKELELQQRVLLMQRSDAMRSDEQYRKFFAKGYRPKLDVPEEKMKEILKKLSCSQAAHELSAIEPDGRLFAVSDPESCKNLSEMLFVPHENALHSPEKKPEPAPAEAPQIRPVKKP